MKKSLVAATLSLSLLIPLPASALSRDAIVSSFDDPDSSGSSLDAALSSLSLLGSSQVPLSGPATSSVDGYPLPLDPSITEARIVEKQVENAERRFERWTVASPSMQRNVSVEIQLPADSTQPAPMLYLLDGVDAPRLSGWFGRGVVWDVLGSEQVTVVTPTEAPGSWYADWLREDPELGLNKWETFLTTELAPLLEAEPELNFNGHRGIGGLSMGATAAVHLANAHPELFDATIGISGSYSPTTPLGRQIINIVTESRGGNLDNMWGPFGSAEWQRHDTTAHPDGLLTMPVYLSAATGVINDIDRERYADDPTYDLLFGASLERGVLSSTEDLHTALTTRGHGDVTVDYKEEGVHNWRNFEAQLRPGWDAVSHALY